MPVLDLTWMLILKDVAFSAAGYPVLVVFEKLALAEEPQAEAPQIIRWINGIGEDGNNIVPARFRVFLELPYQGLPTRSFDQVKTAMRDNQVEALLKPATTTE